MSNSIPMTSLGNYSALLEETDINNPFYIIKDGKKEYAVVRTEELERLKATVRLLGEIEKGERSARENGWLTEEEIDKALGL